ncbi:hypothetical protein [Bartonella tribocorum]|uniref:Uncharacterized protein n=1 Tax=Bartonella tribocorum TaxID=85701 RepID=A0A2M6UWA2_9HYPH|nr:hypothetical protein [Bartonella tribocorum]PIT70449.1 hypothetical protein CEV08_03750 [Bartonella tribocorum]
MLQELEYNQKKKEIEDWEINKRDAEDRAYSQIKNTMGAIDKALDIIEKNPQWAAGIGGSFAQIFPRTDVKILKN